MVDASSIRSSSSLLQEALAAGRKRIAEQGLTTPDMSAAFEQLANKMLEGGVGAADGGNAASGGTLGREPRGTSDTSGMSGALGSIGRGIAAVDGEVRAVDSLEQAVVSGKVQDFHEIAAQIKRADLALSYAMEVRNRLIDAYRETMRMSV